MVGVRSCCQLGVGSEKTSGDQPGDLSLSREIERHYRRTDGGRHGFRSCPLTDEGSGLGRHLTYDADDRDHCEILWHLTFDLCPVGHYDEELGDRSRCWLAAATDHCCCYCCSSRCTSYCPNILRLQKYKINDSKRTHTSFILFIQMFVYSIKIN